MTIKERDKAKQGKLSSEELAGLIVDALYSGGIVSEASYSKALTIVMEEIDVRKAGGDY